MANVGYEDYNSKDVATLLNVTVQTVFNWCQLGYIRYQDVSSSGSSRPRYMFTEDEVERVSKLMRKYGVRAWLQHHDEGLIVETHETEPEVKTDNQYTDPADYIVDESDKLADLYRKKRALEIRRCELLDEVDKIDESIKNIKQMMIEMI